MSGPVIVPYILSTNCKDHHPWIVKVLGAKVEGDIHHLKDHTGKDSDKIMHMRLLLEGHDLFMSDDIDPAKKPRLEAAEDAANGEGAVAEANGKDQPARGGSCTCVYVESKSLDDIHARAVENGATIKTEPADMFWGQRWCQFIDPFGTQWMIAKTLEHMPAPSADGDKDAAEGAGSKRAAEA